MLVRVSIAELLPLSMPPPSMAVSPLTVTLMSERVPRSLNTPPPWLLAELPQSVALVSDAVPRVPQAAAVDGGVAAHCGARKRQSAAVIQAAAENRPSCQ